MNANVGSGDRRRRFDGLIRPLLGPLYGTALRLTRNESDAADLVQECCVRAYRTFDNFTPGTNARAWLFTILYSIHVNAYHRRRRRPAQVSIDAVDADGQLEIPDWSGTAAILGNPAIVWEGSAVERALARLPEPFRDVVVLVDLEELSYEEAASAMDCPVGTVRSRLHRARRALAIELRGLAETRGYLRTPESGPES